MRNRECSLPFFKPFWDEHLKIKIRDLDFYCMTAGYGQVFLPSSELMKRESRKFAKLSINCCAHVYAIDGQS